MTLRFELTSSLTQVSASDWDALGSDEHPFTEHAFLLALEQTGCVGGKTGWAPAYLLGRRADGALVAAAPSYLKSHSYGEYVFDFGWADAARRAGIPYFPRFVVAAPMTPATGPRALVASEAPDLRRALGEAAIAAAAELGASSVHWLFLPEAEVEALGARYLPRLGYQFQWYNQGYRDFEDFLDAMSAHRRKEIRRERRQAAAAGLELAVEPAGALSAADWDAVWRCYLRTHEGRWSAPYLTRAFFEACGGQLAHRAVVATARRGGALVAMTLSFERGGVLYGRYWGALEDHRALHFELCYYQLVERAIRNRMRRVEAGAQGEHKLARGFVPTATWSAHHLRHPGLHAAVSSALVEERAAIRAAMAEAAAHAPFRAT